MKDSPCAHLALESGQMFGARVTYRSENVMLYLLISQHAVNFSELDE